MKISIGMFLLFLSVSVYSQKLFERLRMQNYPKFGSEFNKEIFDEYAILPYGDIDLKYGILNMSSIYFSSGYYFYYNNKLNSVSLKMRDPNVVKKIIEDYFGNKFCSKKTSDWETIIYANKEYYVVVEPSILDLRIFTLDNVDIKIVQDPLTRELKIVASHFFDYMENDFYFCFRPYCLKKGNPRYFLYANYRGKTHINIQRVEIEILDNNEVFSFFVDIEKTLENANVGEEFTIGVSFEQMKKLFKAKDVKVRLFGKGLIKEFRIPWAQFAGFSSIEKLTYTLPN